MKIYLVGGAVRDWLLGRCPEEFDFAFDADAETFLQANPGARKVGRTISVIMYRGREYMPLRGGGLAGDLASRDLTINALAVEKNGVLHGHPLALNDLRDRLLRPASDTAFFDDPLRVFRVARLACALPDFRPHASALDQMRRVAGQGLLAGLPAQRVGAEVLKALGGPRPSAWLEALRAGGCLVPWFAELAQAADIPAGPPPWHDGSVLRHLGQVMDAVAGDPLRVWMALCHDLGKTLTPPGNWPHHYGHESLGETPARRLAERLSLPRVYGKAGALVSLWHMRAGQYLSSRPGTRRDLLVRVHEARLWEPFWAVVEADAGRPLRPAADADLAALLSVRLPSEWRDRGEESGLHLRELQCRALSRTPRLPGNGI